jgi:hypothetical protein
MYYDLSGHLLTINEVLHSGGMEQKDRKLFDILMC